MLKKLSISNYALIEHIEIDLKDGLSIITGETGAGKSIVIGALSLILGQRADTKVVRDSLKKTVVEATFDISHYQLQEFFVQNDLDYFPSECIVRREISPSGRTRSFVNDIPVTLSLLAELSVRLIDIHSQHSNALLLTPSYQLSVIDNLAGNKAETEAYQAAYRQLLAMRREYESLVERISKKRQDEEYFRFQAEQLSSAHLEVGEQERLEREKTVLENLTLLRESLGETCQLLNDGDGSVVDLLSQAEHRISSLGKMYDGAKELSDRLGSILIEAKDIYDTVSRNLHNLGDDTSGLEEIDERLSLLYSLQQKFRVDSVEELLTLLADYQRSLAEIDNSEEDLHALSEQVAKMDLEVGRLAQQLTETRKQTSSAFMRSLKNSASYLGLKNFAGEIVFEKAGFGPTGQDKIHFMVSFNVNQKPLLIEESASGGELSRLMLCIKSIIAEKMQLPTIIFDEIDTGVSGEVANKIGQLMKKISKDIQVITITHLPQVAALGSCHYKVYKQDSSTETITRMKELDLDGRVKELAGMLSGAAIDEAAIENAKSLMKLN